MTYYQHFAFVYQISWLYWFAYEERWSRDGRTITSTGRVATITRVPRVTKSVHVTVITNGTTGQGFVRDLSALV